MVQKFPVLSITRNDLVDFIGEEAAQNLTDEQVDRIIQMSSENEGFSDQFWIALKQSAIQLIHPQKMEKTKYA
mgnify:CR=1 FL=1